jgi:hypothetical protein
VNGAIGQPAGIILWETKRTRGWSDGWLAKLRDDQRRSGADVALIVSKALPKHVEQFDWSMAFGSLILVVLFQSQ